MPVALQPTIPLYDEDAYAVQFTASVLSVDETGVVLDRTLFFPEQGGQKSDTGILTCDGRSVQVRDVRIRNGVITHVADWGEEAPFTPGCTVTGEIDWVRRFDFMQHHSGEHIISGTAHRLYGCDNTGFHLTENEMTLDFSRLLTAEEIARLELEVNKAVWKDVEIVAFFPASEEAERLDYRSKIDITEGLRIVTIEGIDVCACCAPHVHRTGEVGFIKVVKSMKNKGNTRLKVVCGSRAYDLLTSEYRILHEISDMLSTSTDCVPERIKRFKDDIYALKGEIRQLKAEVNHG